MSKLKKDLGTIQRAVQILAGTYNKDLLSFEVAQVITVDTKNWLCSAQLVSGTVQTTYNNIQLTSEKASNGFIQVPKVNSNVILAITWRNEVYVFMCSEIDALVFHQANPNGSFEEFVINCNSGFNPSLPLGITISDGGGNGIAMSSTGTIQMNDGSYGGLVIGAGSNGLQAQINQLNNQVQALIKLLSGGGSPPLWTPAPNDGGAALQAAAYALAPTIPNADFSNIINADVTHGPKVS